MFSLLWPYVQFTRLENERNNLNNNINNNNNNNNNNLIIMKLVITKSFGNVSPASILLQSNAMLR